FENKVQGDSHANGDERRKTGAIAALEFHAGEKIKHHTDIKPHPEGDGDKGDDGKGEEDNRAQLRVCQKTLVAVRPLDQRLKNNADTGNRDDEADVKGKCAWLWAGRAPAHAKFQGTEGDD